MNIFKLKILGLIIAVFFSSLKSFSQELNDRASKNHEVKLNMGLAIFGFPEFSYNYLLNHESSVGFSVAFDINNEGSLNFLATPHYRMFFGKKKAAGFFAEINAAVFSEEVYNGSEDEIGLGAGLAVGGKFLTKNAIVFELFIGLGRNFINTDVLTDFYPRIGISIGKRF